MIHRCSMIIKNAIEVLLILHLKEINIRLVAHQRLMKKRAK